MAEIDEEVHRLERRMETTHLTIPQERAALAALRKLREERRLLAETLATQRQVVGEYAGLSASIDGLLRQADAEHAEVVRLAAEADLRHAAVLEARAALDQLDALIDKTHAASLKARETATRYHTRAVELRSRIIETQYGPQEERGAQEREVAALNATTARTLGDPASADRAVDEALAQLRRKGRVRIQ